jgi:hypothetical protein
MDNSVLGRGKRFQKYLIVPVLAIIIDWFFGFQIYSNDFLGYLGLASVFDLYNSSTHYNGVYPPGYVVVLDVLDSSKWYFLMKVKAINYACLGMVFYCFHSMIFRDVKFVRLLFAFVVLLITSKVFLTNILSPGSYPIFLIFSVSGIAFYESKVPSERLLGAFALILATFFRYEGFVWLICLWISNVIHNSSLIGRWKEYVPILGSLALLSVVSFFGTNSLFATRQFLTFETPEWVNLNPYTTFSTQDSVDYILGYLNNLGREIHYFVALILSWIFLKKRRMLVLSLVLYLLLIKLHSSPRGAFLVLPFLYVFSIELLSLIFEKRYAIGFWVSAVLFPVLLYFSMNNYYQKRKIQILAKSYLEVDLELKRIDPNWKVESLFTNSHDFYVENQLPKTAKVNGRS